MPTIISYNALSYHDLTLSFKGVDVVLGATPVLLAAAHAPAPSRWRPGIGAAGEESAAAAAATSTAAGPAEQQVDWQLQEEESAAAGTAVPAAARRAPPPGLQLVLLGTGEPWMEAALDGLARSFPGQVWPAGMCSVSGGHKSVRIGLLACAVTSVGA